MCKLISFNKQSYLFELQEQHNQLLRLKQSYQAIIDDFEAQKNIKIGYLLLQLNLSPISRQEVEKPEEIDTQEVKKIFRELSKKIHPDKTQDAELKSLYLELFQALNEAKQNNDIELLRKIKAQIDSNNLKKSQDDELEIKIHKLELQITQIKIDIDEIEKRDDFKHIQALDGQFDTYFQQVEKELKYKILKEKAKND